MAGGFLRSAEATRTGPIPPPLQFDAGKELPSDPTDGLLSLRRTAGGQMALPALVPGTASKVHFAQGVSGTGHGIRVLTHGRAVRAFCTICEHAAASKRFDSFVHFAQKHPKEPWVGFRGLDEHPRPRNT